VSDRTGAPTLDQTTATLPSQARFADVTFVNSGFPCGVDRLTLVL
jgi:hypothetical protein